MFKILFAGLLFLIFTQNIYAFTKVNVKYKEVRLLMKKVNRYLRDRISWKKEINGRL